MDTIHEIFGQGDKLTLLNMCCRTILIFFICLFFIRLSGRRSFGMSMPFDNVITILLGAILSRAIVGASPFFSTIAAGATIAVLHRACAWIGLYSDRFGKIIKGDAVLIYEKEKLIEENMKKCMVTKKDLIEEIRLNSNTESFEHIKKIYVERDGQISIVKKQN